MLERYTKTITKEDIDEWYEEQKDLSDLLDLSIETNYYYLMYQMARAKLAEKCQQGKLENRG